MTQKERDLSGINTELSPEMELDFLIGVMNDEIQESLEGWKYFPASAEAMARLNTVFGIARKADRGITFEVRKGAVLASDNILTEEAEIYGAESTNSWLFSTPKTSATHDACSLAASDISGEPRLVFYHLNHGIIGRFRPSDVISIKLQ